MEEMDHLAETVSGETSPDMVSRRAPVAITLFDCGVPKGIEAYEGESLMIALKRAGIPLLAVCGGKGACGTCKVAFPAEWASRLNEPEKRELRLLTHIKAQDGERLSCRIALTTELNGLEVDACD